jgi:hypothetical protein
LAEEHLCDYGQEDAELGDELHAFMVKKRRGANESRSNGARNGRGRTDSGDAEVPQKKKRKGRLCCTCKGGSFGTMIACDNKRFRDRSNCTTPVAWVWTLWRSRPRLGTVHLVKKTTAQISQKTVWTVGEFPNVTAAPLTPCLLLLMHAIECRNPVASVTYGDMISYALSVCPEAKYVVESAWKRCCSHFSGRDD